MKPYKLLACLVTLQFTSGLTLKAADQQDFRQWTDTNGRTMMARIVETPDAASVKIERQDGRFFTVPLKTFSADDQAYVKTYRARNESGSGAADTAGLAEPDAVTWTLLKAGGKQPASLYNKTQLDAILDGMNDRLAAKSVKTATGLPLKVRTEPSDLAARVQISGDMPGMDLAAFIKEVARVNDLVVKTDASGMVVLVDKAEAPSKQVAVSFFGVPANSP